MQIFLESVLIAVLATPLGIPWLAIPYALVRLAVGSVEASAAEDIAASPPGDRGVLVEALIGVGAMGALGALVLFGLMYLSLGGAL